MGITMDSNEKKTVLHLIDTTGPGGAETVFIQLADRLRGRGYRSIVVIRGPGWVHDELCRRQLDPLVMDAKGSFAFGYLFRLIRLAKREKVDLIQSHLLGSNVYAAMLGLIIRKPVVATYHGMVDVNPRERFRRLKQQVMRWGIRCYVAVSQSLADAIHKQGLLEAAKTHVVYNGVDPEAFSRRSEHDLRQQLGLNEEVKLWGCLGNVRPAKAYDVLVNAMALIQDENPRLHVVVAGHQRASLMAQLREQVDALGVGDRLHFIGFIDDSAAFLRQLDYFVLPSRSEGFSIATIEAMMAGLPIVATRCGGPEEILTHEKTGWLVNPDDPRALAEAMLRLSSNDTLARDLASAGQYHSRACFGIDAMVNSYQQIYASILELQIPVASLPDRAS